MRRVVQFLNWVKDQLKGKLYAEIQTITSEIGNFYDFTAAAQETIYDIPAGKRFSLEWIIIENEESGVTRYIFYDSEDTSTPIMELNVAATTITEIKNLKGIVFDTIVEATPDNFTTGSRIMIGGVLCDQ